MESNNDFYVLLPSNVDANGTPAKYSTTLERSITLDNYSKWEFALVEMSFNDSIKTFAGNEYFQFEKNKDDLGLIKKKTVIASQEFFKGKFRVVAQNKHWTTDRDTIVKMLMQCSEFTDYIKVDYRHYRTMQFSTWRTHGRRIQYLKLSPALAWALGVEKVPEGMTVDQVNSNLWDAIQRKKIGDRTLVFKPVDNFSYNAHNIERRYNEENSTAILPERPGIYWFSTWTTYDPLITGDIRTPDMWFTKQLPAERFSSLDGIINGLNNTVLKDPEFKKHQVVLKKQDAYDKLELTATGSTDRTHDGETIHMNDRLATILGFTETSLKLQRGKEVSLKARYPPDYRRSIYSIYVYCNLCNEMIVGDRRVPLLRNVAFNTGKWGATISVLFNSPLYVGLNASLIDTINLELRDDMGELIPFTEGKTVITLHFRRRL